MSGDWLNITEMSTWLVKNSKFSVDFRFIYFLMVYSGEEVTKLNTNISINYKTTELICLVKIQCLRGTLPLEGKPLKTFSLVLSFSMSV